MKVDLTVLAIPGFVGSMVGLERTIVPILAEQDFGLRAGASIGSFIIAFAIAKAVFNLFAGAAADRWGRRRVLIIGWLVSLPVAPLLAWAPTWEVVVFANLLLGVGQALTWSMTLNMMVDLVPVRRRGFAAGINEFAGYLGVSVVAFMTGLVAAEFGLPYSFASHFAPQLLNEALEIYRSRFKPSEQLDRPYAMVGVNVIAAETDEEARRLATSQQMNFTDIFRGRRQLTRPPIDNIDDYWSPLERNQVSGMLARSITGSLDTVRKGLEALVEETKADELIVVSDIYDHGARLRSHEIIAEAGGIG